MKDEPKRYEGNPVAGTEFLDVHATRPHRMDSSLPAAPVLHRRAVLDDRATLAMELIGRWGMIAGMPDGEDSAGRAKLRVMTPDEVAKRAIECVAAAYATFDVMEWITAVPSIDEMNDILKDAEDKN